MERPGRAQLNTQIYQEACEWFIECRAGDLDAASRSEFDRWLRKSPEHQRAYLEIAAIWNEGPTLDPANKWNLDTLIAQAAEDPGNIIALERVSRPINHAPQPVSNRTETSERTRAAVLPASLGNMRGRDLRQRDDEGPGQSPGTRADLRGGKVRFFAIAASILLVTVSLAAYLLMPSGVYATALGEQRSLALTDGSTVQLDSLSKIRIRYSEHERTVELVQGQALFHVAKDSARPFVVYSGQTRVRAVGTRFDVYRKANDTIVTVVEGRVAVIPTPLAVLDRKNPAPGIDLNFAPFPQRGQGEGSAARPDEEPENTGPGPGTALQRDGNAALPETILLAAGEQITVTPGAARRTVHPNLAGATAWTQRQLVFDSTSLTDVADEFNRYNERKLVINPSALGTLHISGVFSSTDPASLIRFLRDRPGLRVTETHTQIRVEKEP